MAKPKTQHRQRAESGKGLNLVDFHRYALRYFRPYAWHSWLILVALLLQAAFRVLLPIGYQQIFDRAILEQDMAMLVTILGLAEAFESMTSAASYKAPIEIPRALKRIEADAGTVSPEGNKQGQFDPEVVRVFLALAEEGPLLPD